MESLNFKDLVVSIREICLIAVFVLFLVMPKWINQRLEDAGFTNVNLGFAQWERTLEESRKEVEEVEQATMATQDKLNQVSQKLESLTVRADLRSSPALRREVLQLKAQVDVSASDLNRSQKELQKSLSNHNIILKDIKNVKKE